MLYPDYYLLGTWSYLFPQCLVLRPTPSWHDLGFAQRREANPFQGVDYRTSTTSFGVDWYRTGTITSKEPNEITGGNEKKCGGLV
jgi:hypothetical protein